MKPYYVKKITNRRKFKNKMENEISNGKKTKSKWIANGKIKPDISPLPGPVEGYPAIPGRQ